MEIIIASFSALFTVVNPFGAMPVFITLTQTDAPKQRQQQALRASLYAALILAVFFLAGQHVLNFFGMRLHDIRIAGGFMILKAGFELLTPKAHRGKKVSKGIIAEGKEKEDISFAPLAMPMLAGPGAIAVSIGMFTPALTSADIGLIGVAILLMAATTFIILLFSHSLTRFLGKAGMDAVSRIMGFIVLSIGVNFISTGIMGMLKL
ncbi:MAG: MarC family protein [Hymenobacteraceae bacterium]|nr:MarC family protein [Hymenobacteraceae bacterium]